MRVNPDWIKDRQRQLCTLDPHSLEQADHIDEHISYNAAAQWLITALSKRGIIFKVYNLGAGVKRITTQEPDKCPCCKRRF